MIYSSRLQQKDFRIQEQLITPSSAENAGFGTTDNEFNMIKLATMQTELANLLKGIEGVKDAKV